MVAIWRNWMVEKALITVPIKPVRILIGRSRKSSASRRNSRFRNIALPGSIHERTEKAQEVGQRVHDRRCSKRAVKESSHDTLEEADFKIVLAEVLHKAAEMPLEKRLHNRLEHGAKCRVGNQWICLLEACLHRRRLHASVGRYAETERFGSRPRELFMRPLARTGTR